MQGCGIQRCKERHSESYKIGSGAVVNEIVSEQAQFIE